MAGAFRRVGMVSAAAALLACGGVVTPSDDTAGSGGASLLPSKPGKQLPQPNTGAVSAGGSDPTSEGGSTASAGAPTWVPSGDPPDKGPPQTVEGPMLADYSMTTINGEAHGSLWGGTIVDDLDRDGYDDLLISDFGGSGPPAALDVGTRGATYLFYGRAQFPAQLSVLDADLVIRGGGETADELGDVDGDGYDDCGYTSHCSADSLGTGAVSACHLTSGLHLLWGAEGRASGEGRADQVGTTLQGPAFLVRAAGDVNGDGYDDVLVGVNTGGTSYGIEQPEMRLLLGGPELRAGGSLDLAVATFVGPEAFTASGAGDVDGDGYDDILFGDSQVSLYYGGPTRFVGELSQADADATFEHPAMWYLLRSVGDLDGDGLADVLLPSGNQVAVYYGRPARFSGRVSAAWSDYIVKPYTSAMEGFAAGDINHDGALDLLLGDPKEQTHGPQSGALFLFPGSSEQLASSYVLGDQQVVLYGDQTVDETSDLGYGTSSGGDLNGDGYDDIAVGKPGNHIGDEGGGQVIVVFGGPFAD